MKHYFLDSLILFITHKLHVVSWEIFHLSCISPIMSVLLESFELKWIRKRQTFQRRKPCLTRTRDLWVSSRHLYRLSQLGRPCSRCSGFIFFLQLGFKKYLLEWPGNCPWKLYARFWKCPDDGRRVQTGQRKGHLVFVLTPFVLPLASLPQDGLQKNKKLQDWNKKHQCRNFFVGSPGFFFLSDVFNQTFKSLKKRNLSNIAGNKTLLLTFHCAEATKTFVFYFWASKLNLTKFAYFQLFRFQLVSMSKCQT